MPKRVPRGADLAADHWKCDTQAALVGGPKKENPVTLNETIDRALARSKDPDPHSIARKLIARMDQKQRDTALSECLADRVRIQITRARFNDHSASETQDNAVVEPRRREGPSKWRSMIQSRIYVPGEGWKFEIDLTAGDLHEVARAYADRASSMTAKALEYEDRAVKLEASGLATWGEYVSRVEQAA